MTASKSLPDRPSLDSLRKQAKTLARGTAAGDAAAIARAAAHLPDAGTPLTQRNAQLVIAREYGYAGWHDLTADVRRRVGSSLEWAVAQSRRVIHDNDIAGLKQLLVEYPALLSWHSAEEDGGVLGMAAGAYGDSFDPNRERSFTRPACAELLIDAGASVSPSVCEGILQSRARGMLQLFQRKGVLPRTLPFLAALGEIDAVRHVLTAGDTDPATVSKAFVCACRFEHAAVASLLLERCIALDPDLGRHVDQGPGRTRFVDDFIATRPEHAVTVGLWKAFVMEQITTSCRDGDLAKFVSGLRQERWLLGDAWVRFQTDLVETATLNGRADIVAALFDRDPALLHCQVPPQSQAIEFALTYAKTHLIPLLTRIWPLPDDLPHAAGTGNLARVRAWFDASGVPALGDPNGHYPYNDARARGHLHWDPPTQQQILDVALAFAVINHHFEVADFLLAHGADINTRWNSHEPASILHHVVSLLNNYESMQFLIDRGIDMTIKDYRWNSTAQGWAMYGMQDEKMAQWLEAAERRRGEGSEV